MSLVLHRLRPYRYIQLQLGESLRSIAGYVETLSGLFKSAHDNEYLYNRLRQQQITIQQEQDSLREMLLSTREMVVDSTVKGRILMMMFLDSIDLFEQVISLHQDYTDVHKAFGSKEILPVIENTLHKFREELNAIGYAIQFNQDSHPHVDTDEMIQQLLNVFRTERKKYLGKNTLSFCIKLRQIIYALQDVNERIKRLHYFSGYEKMSARNYKYDSSKEL